jgi:hypothetical protein
MKYAEPRSLADPEKAARKLLEIANATESVQDGRIFIETINGTGPASPARSPRAGSGSTSLERM